MSRRCLNLFVSRTRLLRIVIAALRAALPWDFPADRLEAMAQAVFDKVNSDPQEDWSEYGESLREVYRKDALAAYRADPIMRELWPEKFA